MKRKHKITKRLFLPFMLLMLFSSFEMKAQREVTGKVTDLDNSPLIGVNVIVKGTTRGTITDFNGNFTITVPGDNTILSFSYVGYQSREVQVGDKTTINVQLKEEAETLDEIVVIGYGTQKKIDLSGSVATVNTEELENLPIKSAAEALKGRASGVFVQSNTGQPGANPSILIRGKTSISAGNDPLLVVDGIPGVSWSEVDFNNVESMTVLKDASSSAIYGSSGANGVILITTRRGAVNKDRISFNYSSGWALPPDKLDVLNSEQALNLVKELNVDGTVSSLLGNQYISSFKIDTTNLYHTDWQDEIFRVGRSNNYNLSFTGGKEDLAYYISGGYFKDKGYIVPTDYERFSFRTNLDYKFSERLRMSTDFNLTRNSSRSITTGEFAWNGALTLIALNTYPFLPVYDDAGGFFINPFRPDLDIPTASINGYYGRSYSTNLNTKYNLTYEIVEGLIYQLDVMNQTGFSKGSNFRSRYHTAVGRMGDGSASSGSGQSARWDINNILRYNREFGEHSVAVMGGFIYNKSVGHSYSSGRRGFPSDTITQVYVEDEEYPGLSISYNANEGSNEYRKYSYIGRLNYNYRSTYIFQFNVRADGSSRFGPDSRWGTFPSASAAWRISNEAFMENIDALSNFTIRYSAGITGNDAFGNYLYATFYNPGLNHGMWNNDDVATGFSSLGGSAPNPLLRWEESFEQNLGVDLSLWSNRISLTADIYTKNAEDLLYNAEMPPHTGYNSGWLNIAKVNTRGVDVSLTTHNISRENFSWTTTLNFSADQNEVLDMGGLGDQFRGQNILREGEPIDAMYGWVMDGIFQNQEDIDALNTTLPDGSIVYYQYEQTAPGDVRFKNINGYETDSLGNLLLDINGNPYSRITDEDRQVIGKPNPDFYYGFENRFRYKNLELSIFFQGVHGANLLSLTRREIERMDHFFNYSAAVLNRWQYEGQQTNVPRATSTDPNNNNRTSTRWMEDASFLRMKYLTLSYRLPDKMLQLAGISATTISLTGENLITFTDYPLYDPETATSNSRGIDMGGYPQARSFSVNVRIDF